MGRRPSRSGRRDHRFPLRERVVDSDARPGDREISVVVELPDQTAEECYIGALDATVADANPGYPATDPVVTVAFVDDLDTCVPAWRAIPPGALAAELAMVDELTLYTYPQSRLANLPEARQRV